MDMVNHDFKDNHVRIARQFGDCQGTPSDDGSFHTLAFIKRILGRICETWLWRMITRDMRFPQFLLLTAGYKDWLSIVMGSIHKEKKAYKKSNKREMTN